MASGFGMLGIPGGELDIFVEFDKTLLKRETINGKQCPVR